uniref:Ig-like domain-containing protein n=1 Tax=Lates calcarifer TaxID=8187 RepID=A0A4W6EFX5_LATCA
TWTEDRGRFNIVKLSVLHPSIIRSRCGYTEWTYEWRPAKLNTPPSHEYRINRATVSDSGDYRCRGRKDYSLTQWSNVITLTVSCKLDVFYHLLEMKSVITVSVTSLLRVYEQSFMEQGHEVKTFFYFNH